MIYWQEKNIQIKYLSAIAKYHVGLVEACGPYHIG